MEGNYNEHMNTFIVLYSVCVCCVNNRFFYGFCIDDNATDSHFRSVVGDLVTAQFLYS